jgi:hypothetical protein
MNTCRVSEITPRPHSPGLHTFKAKRLTSMEMSPRHPPLKSLRVLFHQENIYTDENPGTHPQYLFPKFLCFCLYLLFKPMTVLEVLTVFHLGVIEAATILSISFYVYWNITDHITGG